MHDDWIWERLGIEPTEDAGEIRRTYARLLKAIDSEADPGAFIALREARDSALEIAAGRVPSFEPLPLPPRPAPPAPPVPVPAAPPPAPSSGEPDAPPPEPEAPPPPQPDPGPRPRMVVAESALPELDQADLDRIEALLAAPQPASWAELEELTRKLLGSPAAERIDLARWLEQWTAEHIARFTPRSDPMIEPAVEHFRWDSDVADLNRPPIIDWILQRRIDRRLKLDLLYTPGGYSALIAELRKPMASPPGKLSAWWKSPRVEYLLAYLDTYNPTVLAGLDGGAIAWWQDHIAAQADAPKAVRTLREWRRKSVWESGIAGVRRPVTPLLLLGLFVVPYIAAWFLLQRGHGLGIRVIGFAWMVFVVLMVMIAPAPPTDQMYQGRSIEPHYLDMETDVGPITAWATEGNLTLARIAGTDPGLYRILSARWSEAAADREDGVRFRESIAEILRKSYCEGGNSQEAAQICAYILARRAGEARAGDGQVAPPATVYTGPVAFVGYRSLEEDVEPILKWIAGGEVNVDRLRTRNLPLYSALIERWNKARAAGTPGRAFQEETARLLNDEIQSLSRGGSYELQSAYWRLFADQAAYARTLGDEICDSWLSGNRSAVAGFPPEIEGRRKALAAQALLDSDETYLRVFGASPSRSLTVPPAIAARAAYLAGLDRTELSVALIGGGTAAQRCDARIGLLEATLAQPREQAERVFEQIAGGF